MCCSSEMGKGGEADFPTSLLYNHYFCLEKMQLKEGRQKKMGDSVLVAFLESFGQVEMEIQKSLPCRQLRTRYLNYPDRI